MFQVPRVCRRTALFVLYVLPVARSLEDARKNWKCEILSITRTKRCWNNYPIDALCVLVLSQAQAGNVGGIAIE